MTDLTTTLARRRVPLGFLFSVVVIWLARPTARSLMIGAAMAIAGELMRVWAAGHLEKGLEVTRSGPYQFVRHPLYLGSALIGAGIAVASDRAVPAVLVAAYIGLTILAAIRHEESGMRAKFGDQYDAYLESRARPVDRPFSLARALKNKEHHAIAGLLVVAAILAWKSGRLF